MDGDDTLDRTIRAIFHEVLGVAPDEVNDGTRRGITDKWDSLGHINLLLALCDRLGVDISPEQALDVETVGDIKALVTQLRGNGAPR